MRPTLQVSSVVGFPCRDPLGMSAEGVIFQENVFDGNNDNCTQTRPVKCYADPS